MKATKYLSELAMSAVLFSGCISHNETVTRDVARRKVEFENETAGRVFYEALSHIANSGTRQEKTSEFEIPVVLDYKRHVVTGPNAAFNDAVERCDTNKDGRISEIEAKIFADQVNRSHR
jgi:PBP1b-binding outer membrane lipoprotein LpoB